MATTPKLTREQVEKMTPKDVHKTIARKMLADGFDFVVDLEKSKGNHLADGVTGKSFMDFFSYFASWAVGHNHPKMADKKFLEKLTRVAAHNPSNSDVYSVEMAQFVATWERVVMPDEMKHVFFVSGGALAVENALKCAFDWKTRKNMAAGKPEGANDVIHFKNCFHGRSGYTLSLTNTDPVKYMYFPKFGSWPRIDNPAETFPHTPEVEVAEKKALDDIRAVLEKRSDDIAAIIIETIQGEGGDNHFRTEFLQGLRQLADKYGVFLVFDEVQCGMGITGKMWAYQHHGVIPDAVCFGKKAQVCGFMATSRVDEVENNVFKMPSRINSTWGANLTDMVRCQRILEIIEEDHLVENTAKVGQHLLAKLQELQAKYPNLISNSRGKGLFCAFDLPTPELRNKLRGVCYDKFMLVLNAGTRSIRFRPSLITTAPEIDEAAKILDDALAHLTK